MQLMIAIAILAVMLPSLSSLMIKLSHQWSQLPQVITRQNDQRYLGVFLRRELQGAVSVQTIPQRVTAMYASGDQVSYQLDGVNLKRTLSRTISGKTTLTTTIISKSMAFTQFSPTLLQPNLLQVVLTADSQTMTYQLFLPNVH